MSDRGARPLDGLKVLELGQLLAGPFCGYMLAGFGAEVIKVEPPSEGDPLRRWRKMEGGVSLWWRSLARDKRSITCNLRHEAGRDLVRRMCEQVDIVIENFRPGRMESWGLGYETLAERNPGLVMVRISGYGQTGPRAKCPGFANIAEAFGGLRHLTGEPDRPSVRAGVSLGDSLAGLHGAYGALAAIIERTRSGRGQVVDVALYESVFNMLESVLPEYDRLGHVRNPTGGSLPGIVPSNTYRCADGRAVVLGANSDRLYEALMRHIGRDDLADDPALAHNDGRSAQAERIDAAIEAWTSVRPHDEALRELEAAGVPVGPIYTIADIAADPQFAARDMLVSLPTPDGRPLRVPAVVPQMSRTPPYSERLGPDLGEHNAEVYGRWLGLSEQEQQALRSAGTL
jgi:crotonobetainyl-CoA:carnitine CoA-transferase CaiB-like acyl-CoA transferase